MINEAAVVQAVKAFTSAFPQGQPIDAQEAFSSACDVAFSLIMTVAASTNMNEDAVVSDFIKAIERRAQSFREGKLRPMRGKEEG